MLFNTNNLSQHYLLVCPQLNGFDYCYLTNNFIQNPSFSYGEMVTTIALENQFRYTDKEI